MEEVIFESSSDTQITKLLRIEDGILYYIGIQRLF